jgi:hypothetical protein
VVGRARSDEQNRTKRHLKSQHQPLAARQNRSKCGARLLSQPSYPSRFSETQQYIINYVYKLRIIMIPWTELSQHRLEAGGFASRLQARLTGKEKGLTAHRIPIGRANRFGPIRTTLNQVRRPA